MKTALPIFLPMNLTYCIFLQNTPMKYIRRSKYMIRYGRRLSTKDKSPYRLSWDGSAKSSMISALTTTTSRPNATKVICLSLTGNERRKPPFLPIPKAGQPLLQEQYPCFGAYQDIFPLFEESRQRLDCCFACYRLLREETEPHSYWKIPPAPGRH